MKKLCLIFGVLSLIFLSTTFASEPKRIINLYPWWNVVSTPAILSSIEFPDWWEWISFSKLDDGNWVSVAANISNIKPMEWFLVNNSNSTKKTMIFNYKTWVAPSETMFQKKLTLWWNFLWITTINNPFGNISWATMSLDFTSDWTVNLSNKINNNFNWNSESSYIDNIEIWEAYWIFVNQSQWIYGWVNNWWAEVLGCTGSDCGTIRIEGTWKNTVLLKARNQNIAEFIVKPSNPNDEGLRLDSFELSFIGVDLTANDIRVRVDWTEYDATAGFFYEPNEYLPSQWVKVQVILKDEMTGAIELVLDNVNGKSQNRRFAKRYEEALVYVTSQEDRGDETRYILGVETSDSDITVSNVKFYSSGTVVTSTTNEVSDGYDGLAVLGDASWAKYIDKIEYDVTNEDGTYTVQILKTEYVDFFKVWSDYIKVYKARD